MEDISGVGLVARKREQRKGVVRRGKYRNIPWSQMRVLHNCHPTNPEWTISQWDMLQRNKEFTVISHDEKWPNCPHCGQPSYLVQMADSGEEARACAVLAVVDFMMLDMPVTGDEGLDEIVRRHVGYTC